MIAWSLATFAGFALACGVGVATGVGTDFESFNLGTVNGQDGWKSAAPGDIPALPFGYDQAVVANSGAPPDFGSKSLRHSNAFNEPTGEFFFQTYSKPATNAAGESLTTNQSTNQYLAAFSFISTQPDVQQPGLFMSVSPDSGFGGRMSFIGLEDTAAGIDLIFYDTPDRDGQFVGYDLGTLTRDAPHTIMFWIKLNPGPDNDLVRIYIDGLDVGQCFTTWENFYRSASQPVPHIDRLQFRSSGGEVLSLVGGGYLFDNVVTTTTNGSGPAKCDTPIEKRVDAPTVSAGGLARYRIAVRNDGQTVARNLRVCDHIPRRMTFVRADRKLTRLGRARCFAIPRLWPGQRAGFHLDLRVDAYAPPGTETNSADVTPAPEPESPAVPEGQLPRPPVAGATRPGERAKARVTVLGKRARPRGGPRPRFNRVARAASPRLSNGRA